MLFTWLGNENYYSHAIPNISAVFSSERKRYASIAICLFNLIKLSGISLHMRFIQTPSIRKSHELKIQKPVDYSKSNDIARLATKKKGSIEFQNVCNLRRFNFSFKIINNSFWQCFKYTFIIEIFAEY